MSRWLNGLNQVSTLLEKLDDRVEVVVEERAIAIASDDGDVGDHHDVLIDDILSKRGLVVGSKDSSDGHDEGDENHDEDDEGDDDAQLQSANSSGTGSDGAGDESPTPQNESSKGSTDGAGTDQRAETRGARPEMEPLPEITKGNSEEHPETAETTLAHDNASSVAKPTPYAASSKETTPSNPSRGNSSRSKKEIELTVASKEAQKEIRVLRRHVVKLNENLELTENEIAALRGELGRAAERMEKDRSRAKERVEAAQKRHAEELNAQRKQHEQSLKDQKTRLEEQLGNYRAKLHELENQRKQEGGDWNKEIAQAFQREQEMNNRVALLEDEKTVLLNQISTLQSQQVALGSRVESLTEASENAMVREREAEDRLDATLSQHARQIGQRQAREADLERTIHELNSALAAKAGKQGALLSQIDGGKSLGGASLEARIELLESELGSATSQLALEKERGRILHQQLVEMSKESTQEASSVQVRLLEYQRRAAEMELTISRLEASLRDAQTGRLDRGGTGNAGASDERIKQQAKLLSEEVVRLRDKLGNSSGELLALKSRLQAALARASKAEEELASTNARVGNGIYDSLEQASDGGPLTLTRRRKTGGSQSSTIRSAMRLNPGQGERTEQIGKVVDAVDSFAVTTGKYLRRNPMARAGFIVYLILLHMWSFVLLFFHAHNFEVVHGAYSVSVGPHALLEQHKQIADKTAAEIKSGST